MAHHDERKAALIAELAQARTLLTQEMRSTRESLDVGKRLRHSVASQKTLWFTGAAITGWLIARLPGRRAKKEKTPKRTSLASAERGGWLLAALGIIGTMIRPAVTSYLTGQLNHLLSRQVGSYLDRFQNGTSQPQPPSSQTRRRRLS